MSVKFTTVLGGAEELKRALQLAIPHTRANVVAAVKHNTEAVEAKAQAAAPKVTGELASTIRSEYTNDGLVGTVKVGYGNLPRRSRATTAKGVKRAKGRTRKTGKGAYAPVVDRGDPRRHIKAQQFLTRPFEQQKPGAIKDIDHALNDSMKAI